MSLRDDALADILAATSPEVLGQDIVIDGADPISAVVKSLTAEDMAQHGFDGISTEGTRLTLSAAALGFSPDRGREMEVDGVLWTVHIASRNGDRLRLTLTRYIS